MICLPWPAEVVAEEAHGLPSFVSASEILLENHPADIPVLEGHRELDDVSGPLPLILFVDVAV